MVFFLFHTHIKISGLSPRGSAAGTKSWVRAEELDDGERRAASFQKSSFSGLLTSGFMKSRGAQKSGCYNRGSYYTELTKMTAICSPSPTLG